MAVFSFRLLGRAYHLDKMRNIYSLSEFGKRARITVKKKKKKKKYRLITSIYLKEMCILPRDTR